MWGKNKKPMINPDIINRKIPRPVIQCSIKAPIPCLVISPLAITILRLNLALNIPDTMPATAAAIRSQGSFDNNDKSKKADAAIAIAVMTISIMIIIHLFLFI
jgi:hypothetical protein